MRHRIDLLDQHYSVTVFGQRGDLWLQVEDGEFQSVALVGGSAYDRVIKLGGHCIDIKMAVKGEMTYIRAFDRTFALRMLNPVEQAAQEAGIHSNSARAPMPGTVIEVYVTAGEKVTRGQSLITIESMKILTAITAPCDGEVSIVHFKPGASFEKNAVLVSMVAEEK